MLSKHKIKTLLAGAAMVSALSAVVPATALASPAMPRAQCQPKDFNDGARHHTYMKSETRTSELGTPRITHFYYAPFDGNSYGKWCAYNTRGREQYNAVPLWDPPSWPLP